MKHKKYRSPKRKLLLFASTFLVVVGGVLFVVRALHSTGSPNLTTSTATKPTNSVDYTPASASDNKATEDRKGSSTASSTPGGSSLASSTPATFSVNITNAFIQNDSHNVRVGTLVKSATEGSCALTASQASQPNITKNSSVQQNVNYYDCGVFNIPFSDFPHTGDWRFTLTVTSGGKQASYSWPSAITIPSN